MENNGSKRFLDLHPIPIFSMVERPNCEGMNAETRSKDKATIADLNIISAIVFYLGDFSQHCRKKESPT